MYSRRVIGVALLVGVGGGAVGSAYLLGIHLLQHVLDPVHWSSTATFVVLGLTGLAVFVIARLLGSPGDVELLVDNIHVSGAPSNGNSSCSEPPLSTFDTANPTRVNPRSAISGAASVINPLAMLRISSVDAVARAMVCERVARL